MKEKLYNSLMRNIKYNNWVRYVKEINNELYIFNF